METPESESGYGEKKCSELKQNQQMFFDTEDTENGYDNCG
jgi:hypothetical protein